MSPAAKDAQIDFVRLSAEEPSSLYFEEFLRHGFDAWPASYQHRFPGLHTWNGVAGLKQSLRQLAGALDDWRVLLASRSMSLVQLATSCMFRVCRNVLTTDLSWPTYQQAIEAKARRTGNRITNVSIRNEILYRGWTADDVASHLATAFEEHQCDGLFLPAVDHLGIRLPIRKIANRIRERNEIRFCFIDAAQAFCQIPLDECVEAADFIVAGSHKWMGAYLPTGIGFFGRRRSRDCIQHIVNLALQSGRTNDPLLCLTEQLDTGCLDSHSETTNLSPIFACAGAVANRIRLKLNGESSYLDDRLQAEIFARSPGWQIVSPVFEMRCRVLLMQADDSSIGVANANDTRRFWLNRGVVLSGYPRGIARVSLPFHVLY
jgi:Aminotransferase class-V